MANTGLNYPVGRITVNEYAARWTALLVLILMIGYIATGYWLFPAFLVLDFFLRGFKLGNYSLLGRLSGLLLNVFGIGNKPVDGAPKQFAAWIGLLFTSGMTILHGIGASPISYILADVVIIFALLEAAFGFCVGCRIYTLVKSFLPSKNQ